MKQAWNSMWLVLVVAGVAGCSKSEPGSTPAPAPAPAAKNPPAAAVEQKEPAHPEGEVALALKWPMGQRLVNQVEMQQKLESYFPGTPEPMRQQTVSTQRYTLTVTKELDGGGRELLLEYGDISMGMRMGERPLFEYDSASQDADDPSNPVSAALGQVRGKQFTVKVNANGEVEDIPGLQQFADALAKDAPPQTRPVLGGMFEAEGIKQLVELGRTLPNKPAQKGNAWPIRMEFSLGALGGITLDATNTFTGWERRQNRVCVVLTAEGTLAGAANRSRGPVGMQTSIEGGQAQGKSWVDPEGGVLVESQIDQKMTMLMTMAPAGQPGGTTITNQLQQAMLLRLIEVQRNK